MKRILVFILVVTVAATSLLSACGDPSANQNSAAPTDTPRPQKTSNMVEVWWSASPQDQDLMMDAWYDFVELCKGSAKDPYKESAGEWATYLEGKYGEVAKDLDMFQTAGDPNSKTVLELLIGGNTAPDLVRMDHVYVTALGRDNNVADLQAEFKFNDEFGDRFIESCIKASSYIKEKDDVFEVYGIPFDANTIIFGAKKTYLDRIGQSLPQTYQEILDTGRKLKALGEDVNVYTLPCGTDTRLNWPTFVFLFYLWRLGGDVLNEDYTAAIFNQEDTGVRALKMMLDMRSEGLMSSSAYEEGDTMLCDYGTWRYNSFNESMEFGLLPQLKEGVERWSGLGLYNLSVVKMSLNRRLAYDFGIHLATQKNSITDEYYQYTFVKATSNIPSLKAAGDLGAEVENDPVKKDFWEKSMEQLALSKWRPAVPQWPDIEEEIWKAMDSVFNSNIDPQEALNAAARKIDSLLK